MGDDGEGCSVLRGWHCVGVCGVLLSDLRRLLESWLAGAGSDAPVIGECPLGVNGAACGCVFGVHPANENLAANEQAVC